MEYVLDVEMEDKEWKITKYQIWNEATLHWKNHFWIENYPYAKGERILGKKHKAKSQPAVQAGVENIWLFLGDFLLEVYIFLLFLIYMVSSQCILKKDVNLIRSFLQFCWLYCLKDFSRVTSNYIRLAHNFGSFWMKSFSIFSLPLSFAQLAKVLVMNSSAKDTVACWN